MLHFHQKVFTEKKKTIIKCLWIFTKHFALEIVYLNIHLKFLSKVLNINAGKLNTGFY